MADKAWQIAVDDNDDGVRTIIVDNPPVNALSHPVRVALMESLDRAESDPAVKAIVLTTGEKCFFSGADIRELDSPVSPRVFDLTARIETLAKPIVAAIHGTALGGGLEVALSCHGRVMRQGSKLGFPEVNIGLIPGAGGTQYVSQLAGPVAALKFVASGKAVDDRAAMGLSLIDEVTEGDAATCARALAGCLVAKTSASLRVRDGTIPAFDKAEYEAEADRVRARSGHQLAPAAAAEAIMAGCKGGFDVGLKRERELFESLRIGPQSKAMRYQFFAERSAARIDGITGKVAPRKIEKIGVVGGGMMGRGIAQAFLAAGFSVTIAERDADAATEAKQAISNSIARDLARRRVSSAQHDERLARIETVAGPLSLLGGTDLVVEAAFENMDVKKNIFANLDQALKPGTILATNTSSLDIDELASVTGRGENVIGMHFFSPANIMRLLEVVRARDTSEHTLATVLDVAKRLQKVPVVVRVCDGFVGNRMLAQRHIAAEQLLLDGALPVQVDKAWTDFGFPMGVFAMTDLAGVDVNWHVRHARGTVLDIHDTIYELGRYGQKTGAGFFRYAPGQRAPQPDPEVEKVIWAASEKAGISRRDITDTEIVKRLAFPMINEGARILEEGIARRASDIDVVWTTGYGWPLWRGGPMYYADSIGLDKIRAGLDRMHADSGDAQLEPTQLLVDLAVSGGSFTA